MNNPIIGIEQLKTATGYKLTKDVEAWLKTNRVPFFYGRNTLFTTIDALNAAMGLKSSTPKNNNEKIEIL